jgi:hypothetical protein
MTNPCPIAPPVQRPQPHRKMPEFSFAGHDRRAGTGDRSTAPGLLSRIRRFLLRYRRDRPTPESGAEQKDMGLDSEVDYFALANLLIDQYGTDARAQAARLMQEAVREEDPLAASDWLAVGHAVALLTNDSVGARH